MKPFDLNRHPHRRYNILIREWVLVSPHRAKRPWLGQVEKGGIERRPEYDPGCYLCPGNERAGGIRNPEYTDTFVFENDFAPLMEKTPTGKIHKQNLLIADSERGTCQVICFSPRHDLTLAEFDLPALRKVVDVWVQQHHQLGQLPFINYCLPFENKGAIMGCSNPHPHCQIWATKTIPEEPAKELPSFRQYSAENQSCLLCDYLQLELAEDQRIVCKNESFVVLVPFWAVWPFETLLLSRRHFSSFTDLTDTERDDLADIIKQITVRYDNLFETSFPFSMGFHQAPTDGQAYLEWHFHAHYYPPLLRSATVKKFMVGFELLGTPQRDLTAESAARRLRELPGAHYSSA
ncbi:UDP-glucose--hexose-1-phosphate uridylyltransferase [candidate division KSB1 bacterium]|nr:UDP-glucose--hexose-1-phosphate uridylyltransferase [candidate division KSB1 bacterium]